MRLEAFSALVYDDPTSDEEGVIDLSSVIATANTDEYRSRKYNVAQLLETPELAAQWLTDGWLTILEAPAMYVYKIGRRDINGDPVQWTGVFGCIGKPSALSIEPKLVPVMAESFSDLLVPSGMPIARASDEAGNHHRIWPIDQFGALDLIADAVGDLDEAGLVLTYEANQPEPDSVLGLVMLSASAD